MYEDRTNRGWLWEIFKFAVFVLEEKKLWQKILKELFLLQKGALVFPVICRG